ncbi:MAG: hypothetical protein M0P73_18785, partial [Syntrophobacterales bacterium]|nr:hypothetical protein [Syntrophobacterales bacterium]
GKGPATAQAPASGKGTGVLWVVDENQKPRQIEVQTGASDGANTVVEGADLREGMQMITGIRPPNSGNGKKEGGNPFLPSMRRGKSGGGH